MNTQAVNQNVPENQTREVKKMTGRNEAFLRLLRQMEADHTQNEKTRAREKAEKAQADQRAKERRRKIAELRALISQLRARLANSGGQDKAIAARLSMAETELFWLMFVL